MKDRILAIPKGTMEGPTISLLEKVGIKINKSDRGFEAETGGIGIFKKVFIMRPQDIPQIIDSGKADVGICGLDCVYENRLEKKLKIITKLNYSKVSRKPVKVIIFGKRKKLIDNEKIRVTSEYPNITKNFFKKARIDFSYGTTEAKVVADMYDYGICITETGKSIKENNLIILKELLVSPTVLISKKESREINFFGELLKGAISAEDYCLITMNIDKKFKKKIISILPSMKSPTVSMLNNNSFSVSTIIEKRKLTDVVVNIKNFGAQNILVQDVNAVI